MEGGHRRALPSLQWWEVMPLLWIASMQHGSPCPGRSCFTSKGRLSSTCSISSKSPGDAPEEIPDKSRLKSAPNLLVLSPAAGPVTDSLNRDLHIYTSSQMLRSFPNKEEGRESVGNEDETVGLFRALTLPLQGHTAPSISRSMLFND